MAIDSPRQYPTLCILTENDIGSEALKKEYPVSLCFVSSDGIARSGVFMSTISIN